MEVVTSARSSVLPVQGDASRVNAASAPGPVKTELPAQATVQQAAPPSKSENGGRGSEPDSATDLARRVTIDPDTQEFVFQKINRDSGEVVRQVPDQAILRMRAYRQEREQVSAEQDLSQRRVERLA
jgi:flagellar protein FlaG